MAAAKRKRYRIRVERTRTEYILEYPSATSKGQAIANALSSAMDTGDTGWTVDRELTTAPKVTVEAK